MCEYHVMGEQRRCRGAGVVLNQVYGNCAHVDMRARAHTLTHTYAHLYAAYESRPDVGSSRKRIEGCVMSSTPMDTRFFSPVQLRQVAISTLCVGTGHHQFDVFDLTGHTRCKQMQITAGNALDELIANDGVGTALKI